MSKLKNLMNGSKFNEAEKQYNCNLIQTGA